jgi:hypothetical protein
MKVDQNISCKKLINYLFKGARYNSCCRKMRGPKYITNMSLILMRTDTLLCNARIVHVLSNGWTVLSMWSASWTLPWNGALNTPLQQYRGCVFYVDRTDGISWRQFVDPGSCQLRIQFCMCGCHEESGKSAAVKRRFLYVIFGVCNSVRILQFMCQSPFPRKGLWSL